MVSVAGKRVERDHLVTRIAGPAAYTDEVARPRPNTLALERALLSAVGQTSLPSKTPAKSVESEWTAIGRFGETGAAQQSEVPRLPSSSPGCLSYSQKSGKSFKKSASHGEGRGVWACVALRTSRAHHRIALGRSMGLECGYAELAGANQRQSGSLPRQGVYSRNARHGLRRD